VIEKNTHPDEKSGQRLEKIDRNAELLPWRRAHQHTRCFLYWMPVSAVPAPAGQRQWLLEFLLRFSASLNSHFGLRAETFLQFKTAMDHLDQFQKLAPKFSPLLGLSRKPGQNIPKLPTKEDMAPVVRGEKDFNLKEWIADYCYWFLFKKSKEQWSEYFGLGGTTLIFLKPDPKTTPPAFVFTEALRKKMPVFQVMDVDAMITGGFAMKDGFLAKSKELFGAGLEDDPQFPGIAFIVPLLGTGHFFGQPEQESEQWFQLFDVYVNESATDEGIVLAFKTDYENLVIDVLKEMKQLGLVYPES
jgi:hypothetical protein